MCSPKLRSGKLDVPANIAEQFKNGGLPRWALIAEFMKLGGDKDRPSMKLNPDLAIILSSACLAF